MAQVIAGEVLTLEIEGKALEAKIEDASKSEVITAKIQSSALDRYQVGQVYEFDRKILQKP